jgi:hypothetical protein
VEVSPVSNLIINANRTPGYLLPGGSVMSAMLIDDLRPQVDCAHVGWDRVSGITKQSAQFEQQVRPVATEGTAGIPPSAYRDALD